MTQSKVVQITNIAPQATRDQMQTLFGYLGKLEDMRLYPTVRDVAVPVQSRICYVKFHDPVCVGVALHMTNTVFIDRAIIVVPFESEIPDEQRALELTNHGTMVPGLFPIHPKLPRNVTNQLQGVPPNQVVITSDPRLVEKGLPLYPPLPATLDARRVEEIRRTLVVSNLDRSLSPQQIIDYFNTAGEVKYVRVCSREDDPGHYALLEFSDQTSIIGGLQMNGKELGGSIIKVYHSTQAIVKPQAKSSEDVQKEIEEAMSRVKEAQNLISAAIDPVIGLLADDKKKRSRSGSRSRRSRSLSRGRRRSHSRSRRSRSRSRRRSRNRHSRSRSRRRSHSRSKHRSRSRDRKRRSRSPRHHRSHSRSRSRSRRRSRSRSRSSHSKSKSKSSKSYDKKDRKEDKKDSKKDSERKDGETKEDKDASEGKDNREIESKEDREKDVEKSKSKDKDKYREKSKSSRKSSSRSPSKSRHRSPRRKSRSPTSKKSRSPTRKKSPHSRRKSHSPSRRRSSSHSRRRSKSPRSSHSRHSPAHRSPSHSKSRRDDKKKERERSHDLDRHDKEDKKRREKKDDKDEKIAALKVSRNYDDEADGDGFDNNDHDRMDEDRPENNSHDDNDGEVDHSNENNDMCLSDGREGKQNSGSTAESNADDMDISTSP